MSEVIDRKVERRVVLSRNAPRVRVWSPTSPAEAYYHIVGLDRSVQGVVVSGVDNFVVPNKGILAISDLYSDDEVSGFSGDSNPQLVGGEWASYAMFKGSLLKDVHIDGRKFPTEMRLVILQTKSCRSEVLERIDEAKKRFDQFRKIHRRKSLLFPD
jgi:hypothetical protein